MIDVRCGLDDAALSAIAALEHEVVTTDGGRLKLEWGTLRSRPSDRPTDVLCWIGDRLVGYAGIGRFGGGPVEIAGMVAPPSRRRGVGSALLQEVRAVLSDAADPPERMLLVAPHQTPAGREFAVHHGGRLDHCEHFLVLGPTVSDTPEDPDLLLRAAGPADAADLHRLLSAAFQEAPGDDSRSWSGDSPGESTLVAVRRRQVVGTVRLDRHGTTAGIYGFAVDPAVQGQGIGRDVLARCCRLLQSEGVERTTLEVDTENDRALGLYTSVGFVPTAGEDYWSVSARAVPS